MQSTCYVVFGDVRGWNVRLVLYSQAEQPHQLPVRIRYGFADVLIGDRTVFGPVLLDGAEVPGPPPTGGEEPAARSVVVYAGRRIPEWVSSADLPSAGWTVGDEIPAGTDVSAEEVDVLLLAFDGADARGWTRTVWMRYVPRPMERVDLQLGDGDGPVVPVRALEVGDDLIVDGDTTPFAVVSCTRQPSLADLERFGWEPEEWVPAKQQAWRGLHELSDVVESHVGTVLGQAMVTEVTLHPPGVLIEDVLPLLPRDVRTAIDFAEDDPGEGV